MLSQPWISGTNLQEHDIAYAGLLLECGQDVETFMFTDFSVQIWSEIYNFFILQNKTAVKVPASTYFPQQNISKLVCLCTCAQFSSLKQVTDFLNVHIRAFH